MSHSQNHPIKPVTIRFTEQLSPGLYLIGFRRFFDFVAGQVIGIAIREDDARRLDPKLKYYLCGSAGMAVETRDILIGKGIPFGQIISDNIFLIHAGKSIW